MADTAALAGPPNYAKYAFSDQHNVIFLFGAAAFSLAFASPVPLFVGLACELGWLAVASRTAAFRKGIDSRLDAQRRAKADDAMEAALGQLPALHSRRFLALSRSAQEILILARNRQGMPPMELQRGEQGLTNVRSTFLEYQQLSIRVASLIDATPIAGIEREAAQLQESYAADKDLSVRMTIRKAMAQNQRQQQQLQQLTSVSRAIELRLAMIEKAFSYLKGQVADAASNLLSHELEKLLAEVGTASHLEQAINDAFSGAGPSWAPSV